MLPCLRQFAASVLHNRKNFPSRSPHNNTIIKISRLRPRGTFPNLGVAWPPRSSLRLLSRGKCRVDAFSHTNPLYRTIRQHFLYQFSSSTSKTKSLFSLKKMPRMRADFFFSVAIGTFGFVFFSLQGLRKGSKVPNNPKMPFPRCKIDHFIKDTSSISKFQLRIQQNQPKSGRDG